VILNKHQLPGLKIGINTACCIGYNKVWYLQMEHTAQGKNHLIHAVTLVIVKSSLQDHKRNLVQIANQQPAMMTFDGRFRKMGYLFKVYSDTLLQTLPKLTES